jgi:phosphoglycerate dehydrogenase-like enzyme
MPMPKLLVTYDAGKASREIIENAAGADLAVIYLDDVPSDERAAALAAADALLAMNTANELKPGEVDLIAGAKLIQFIASGIDFVPLSDLPDDLTIASNGGAYAEPMAEHGLMMTLAALKRLTVEQDKMKAGTFDQFEPNRMLSGTVCGILGFGGIGKATARLMRAFGAKVHAINRSGKTEEPVDWIGTDANLGELLKTSDVLILSLPLTPASKGLIGKSELAAMKPDAILVNLARGEIIDETALYEHLKANPDFWAGIDAWWVEPVRHGRFEMAHDFLSLPNVIASPHNSASVHGWREVSLGRAIANIRRVLIDGKEPLFRIAPGDRMG